MNKRTEHFLTGLILLAFTLVIFFFILEITVRIFFPQSLLIEKYDPKLGIVLKPNMDLMQYNEQLKKVFSYHVITNNQGLREKEDILFKKNNEYRILFLGDSLTFGKGANQEETAVYVLNQLIKQPNVEVINFGVSGVNMDYYYLNLVEKGLKFEPDVVILGIDALTDFGSQGAFFTIQDGLLNFNNGRLEYTPPKKENKFTFFIASYLQSPRFLVLLLDRNPVTREIVKFFRLSRAKKSPLFTSSQEEYLKYKQLNFEILKRIKELSQEKNFKLIVFLFPSKEQVIDDAYLDYIKNSGVEEVIDRYDIQKDLKGFMINQNIHYIDLTQDFIEENKKRQLFYTQELHWNLEGNQFVAEKVYEELKKLHIISS